MKPFTLARLGYQALLRKVPVAPAASPIGSVRAFGIFDRFTNSFEERREKRVEHKKEEVFKAQIEFLKGKEGPFRLGDYAEMTKQLGEQMGITGWKSKLRTQSMQEAVDAMTSELRVADALQPEDLENPKNIRRKEKVRIANDAGVDVSSVNKFIAGFEQAAMMHTWVQDRLARGLDIPTVQEEAQMLMQADKSALHKQGKVAKKKMTGRVRSLRKAMGGNR